MNHVAPHAPPAHAGISHRLTARLSRHAWAYRCVHRARLLAFHVTGRGHDPDFAGWRAFAARDGVFLDVGANIGQSILAFRAVDRRRPIVAIEANPELLRELRLVGRIARRCTVHQLAASDRPGTITLQVPFYRGLALTGEATTSAHAQGPDDLFWFGHHGIEPAPGEFTVRRHRIRAAPLDDLGLAPAFVKIDVEGHEGAVLRGLRRTLERHHPVLLLETPDDSDVAPALAAIGYTPWRFDSARDHFTPGLDPQTRNTFFVSDRDRALIAGWNARR